jgi:hypothetical protein
MQTSRFQLGLIATLAVGLGFSLASSQAIGYPAGAAVSIGTNPVLSTAGSFTVSSSVDALSAPADQDIVITDFAASADTTDWDCLERVLVVLTVDGALVGQLSVTTPYLYQHYQVETSGSSEVLHLNSGIRIPAGSALSVSTGDVLATSPGSCWSGREVNIHYTLSGYHSQP